MNFLKYALPLFLAASALGAAESKDLLITCNGSGEYAAERFVIHYVAGSDPTLDEREEGATPNAPWVPVTVEGTTRPDGAYTEFKFISPLRGENARWRTVRTLRIDMMNRNHESVNHTQGTYHGQDQQCHEYFSMFWSNQRAPEDFSLNCTIEQ